MEQSREAVVAEIAIKVKANIGVLDSCVRHAFTIDATPHRPFGKQWQCSACGGQVSSSAKMWYERGRADQASLRQAEEIGARIAAAATATVAQDHQPHRFQDAG